LAKKYKNFIFSQVWPHYADVIAAMKKKIFLSFSWGYIERRYRIAVSTINLLTIIK
jgi:hypothetical protein